MSDIAIFGAGIVLGWVVKGVVHDAVVSIMHRILTSAIGKERMLRAIGEGIAKMDRRK